MVQEVERTFRRQIATEEIIASIREAITREHEIAAREIVLIRTGTSAQDHQRQDPAPPHTANVSGGHPLTRLDLERRDPFSNCGTAHGGICPISFPAAGGTLPREPADVLRAR